MKILKYWYPTFPKIFLYSVMTFITPALFSVCSEAGCSYEIKLFPGALLLRNAAEGTMTAFSIVLWLGLSYALTCLAAFGLRKLAKKKKGF